MYEYALIGNCQASALVGRSGSIDWLCLPRPDSPPVFGRLLDPDGGHFSIVPDGDFTAAQSYLENTNVLVTTFQCADGSSFRIVDFLPRFEQYGRVFRPLQLCRMVEPVRGTPAIRVVIQPVAGWAKTPAPLERGNSHLRFTLPGGYLRLTTNMPLTYLRGGLPMVLQQRLDFALSYDAGFDDDLAQVCERFRDNTIAYWRRWVKHCDIPSTYQEQTIRSALTLKLHCYEDTGAILAALTTSLPEAAGSERNWDYRYCWLRDAHFVLTAFHHLGQFEEMEGFLQFLVGIARRYDENSAGLHPVYALDGTPPVPEYEYPAWAGFAQSRPVRSGNLAAEHVQNDVYGELVLTLAPIYFDERFRHLRSPQLDRLMAHLAIFCEKTYGQPDAGLWELRNGWQVHTFSNLMSWAGLERLQRIRMRGHLPEIDPVRLAGAVKRGKAEVLLALSDKIVRNGPADETLDAALLMLPSLRFPNREVNEQTVLAIAEQLAVTPEGFLYRYLRQDDFGKPGSAFVICSFWLVQALAKLGHTEKARAVTETLLRAANHVGLFSEHFEPATGRQLGNFPQAYSHVGMINAAFAISPPWDDVL